MSAHPQDELLAAALDGTLTPPERETVEAHLAVCALCREDLELARTARGALRDLPREVRPPIDVAAAVISEISGRRSTDAAEPVPTPSAPRWYRAAGLVAAAAAIALAVMVVPNIVGGDADDPRSTAALEAGGSEAAQASGTDAAAGMGQDLDFDGPALQNLADESVKRSVSFASGSELSTADQAADRALDCVRSAAGSALPPDAVTLRLLSATYGGTPAYIGVFHLPGGRADVWAAARDDCRSLASATAPPHDSG
jgi:hypothetical protein